MKKIIALFCCCLALAGCLGAPSKPAQFYTLTDVTGGKALSQKSFTLSIDSVDMPNYLDKPQIVTMDKQSGQVNVSEMNRWIEPFGHLFQRTLINDLYQYLPNAVITNTLLTLDKADKSVFVQINQLNAAFNGQATLDVLCKIRNKDGKVIYEKRSVFTEPVGDSYDSISAAASALVGKLAKLISQEAIR